MGISTVSFMLYRANLIDYLGWMNQHEESYKYSYDVCTGWGGGRAVAQKKTGALGLILIARG